MIETNTFWSEEDQSYICTCKKYPSMSGIGDTPEDAIEELIIAIEATGQQPEPEDKWISVEDRLPEDTKAVMAFAPQIKDSPVRKAFYSKNAGYFFDAFECGCGICLDSITHWQPLPPPPTNQEER